MKIFEHLLVPTDFGESSARALDLAMKLALDLGASLTLLHVYEIPMYGYTGMEMAAIDLLTPIEDAAREQLATTLADVKRKVPAAKSLLRRGVVWREIVATIEETHPDLVVMGTHGRHGVSHVLLGSVADKIVRTSPVPVLTVREAKPQ
jgi:nucleotide-binding universal stress UspA family protein